MDSVERSSVIVECNHCKPVLPYEL